VSLGSFRTQFIILDSSELILQKYSFLIVASLEKKCFFIMTASPPPAVITPLIAPDLVVPSLDFALEGWSSSENVDSVVRFAGNVLGDALTAEKMELYSREWKDRESLAICLLCDKSAVKHRALNPSCVSDGCPGCFRCSPDFYSKTGENGKTVILCEYCFEGSWCRFGRKTHEVIRVTECFLMESAESLSWKALQAAGKQAAVSLVDSSFSLGIALFRDQIVHDLYDGGMSAVPLVCASTLLLTPVLRQRVLDRACTYFDKTVVRSIQYPFSQGGRLWTK
jgi:hypothetical protein